MIAGSLQKTLAKHLPLDVLTIDTGGAQGVTGTQVEAGRYVTDRLYVGYVAPARRRSDAVPESKRRPHRVPADGPLADRRRVRRRRDRLGRLDVEKKLLSRATERAAPAEAPRALAATAARSDRAAGSSTVNVHPAPGADRTSTRPPCASAMRLTVASPRPMPGWRLFGPRTYGSNTCSPSSGGRPGPLSSTSIRTRAPCRSAHGPRAHDDARRRDVARIFDRVAQEVGDQAGQNARVAGDRPRRLDLGDDQDFALSLSPWPGAISLMAPAITSATSAWTPGSGRAPARAKARRPSAISRARMIPARPDSIARAARSGEAVPRAKEVERQVGGRQRPDHVVGHPPGERLQLVGPPFEQRRRAPHQSPGERSGDERQQHADRIQHDGVDHRLPPQLADGAPELPALGGVEVDEAQDGRVEAIGGGLQLLLQHGAHLDPIGVPLDLLEPRDGRREIRSRLLGRRNQLGLARKAGQGAVAVPVVLERGERRCRSACARRGAAPRARRRGRRRPAA